MKLETTVVNLRTKQPYDLKIDRSSMWGNPFTHLKGKTLAKYQVATRKDSIREFKRNLYKKITEHPWLLEKLKADLSGKKLACWCHPLPCHGDIYADICNNDKSLEQITRELSEEESNPPSSE